MDDHGGEKAELGAGDGLDAVALQQERAAAGGAEEDALVGDADEPAPHNGRAIDPAAQALKQRALALARRKRNAHGTSLDGPRHARPRAVVAAMQRA